MRARNIKPGFFKNEELAECSFQARLLFAGLWCMADREGRLEKRPLRIKAEIFPYDNIDINGELTVIERKGFVQTYVVDGKEYLQVLYFKDHQHPHHTEAASKLPEMTEENVLTVNSRLNNGEYPADSLIHRFSDSLIPDSSPRNDKAVSKEIVASVKPTRPATKKKVAVSDQEWLQSLVDNPAYSHINVPVEFGKLVAWCEVKNKQPTRSRFLGWLNRIEKPIKGIAATTRQQPKTFDQIRQENNFKAAIDFAGDNHDGPGQKTICRPDGDARRSVLQRRIEADDGNLLPIFDGLPD